MDSECGPEMEYVFPLFQTLILSLLGPCQISDKPHPLSCLLCRTPLMLAIMNGHVDCVHLLLEKGSTADAADLRGRTALHRGVRRLLGVRLFTGRSWGGSIGPTSGRPSTGSSE